MGSSLPLGELCQEQLLSRSGTITICMEISRCAPPSDTGWWQTGFGWVITGDQHGAGLKSNVLSYKGKASLYLLVCLILLAIAVVVPWFRDAFSAYRPNGDSDAQWFERSGAVMTVFALLAVNFVDNGVDKLLPRSMLPDDEAVDAHKWAGPCLGR